MADNREVHPNSNVNNENILHMDQVQDPAETRKRKLNDPPSLPVKKRKFERFDIASNSQSWQLPDELKEYAMKAINRYLPEKDVQENIIEDCPVPSNLVIKKEMDLHFKNNQNKKDLVLF